MEVVLLHLHLQVEFNRKFGQRENRQLHLSEVFPGDQSSYPRDVAIVHLPVSPHSQEEEKRDHEHYDERHQKEYEFQGSLQKRFPTQRYVR